MPLFPDDPGELCAPGDVIRAILADDYTLSNAEIALMAHVTWDQVRAIRYSMVCTGLIPPSRVTTPQPVRFKPIPPAPRELAEGACVGVLPSPHVSDDPAERERAKQVCVTCHVRVLCLEWALAALPRGDLAIYAGTTRDDRIRLRAQRAGKPEPAWLSSERRNAARARRAAARREAAEAAQARDQAAGGAA